MLSVSEEEANTGAHVDSPSLHFHFPFWVEIKAEGQPDSSAGKGVQQPKFNPQD